ncbi:MAG: response regulator [Rickettsiales bacterium]|nr:response regulator [Rickettsiales bacterium]
MSKRSALVVDDSFTMRNMVSLALKEEDFDVTLAGDGVEALNVSKGKKFDVIVTDINMPNMDGLELIKNLREKDEFKFTPILVLTTEGGDDKKKEGKKLGATGWIVKPFNPEVLIATINKVCS